MKLKYPSNKAVLPIITLAILTLFGLFLFIGGGILRESGSSQTLSQVPQPPTTTHLENLIKRAQFKLPLIASKTTLTAIPKELAIFYLPEAYLLKIESLSFEDNSQGYFIEFNLDYPLFSSINYYIKLFNDNGINKLYGGFGEDDGVLYGKDDQNYIVLIFRKLDENNTKITIQKYAQ